MNLTKNLHFQRLGMRPCVFSEQGYSKIYLSWTNKTEEVALTRLLNGHPELMETRVIDVPHADITAEKSSGLMKERKVYKLSFKYTFKYDNDVVYFALHKPFCYSRMKTFISRLEMKLQPEVLVRKVLQQRFLKKRKRVKPKLVVEINASGILYKREVIAFSVAHIPIEMITITSSSPEDFHKEKTYIVITARVHAAETPGSYKVQGILSFLTGSDPVAKKLRESHVFLILPMLNPDGVIMGNNRCSLAGADLNRCWGLPHAKLNPELFRLKKYLLELCNVRKKQILIYCDLHGHSRLLNSFMYACHKETGTLCSWTQLRLLPRLLAKETHIIDFSQCSFHVTPDKASTGRVIIWKELKVVNSFTLETSQYAFRVGANLSHFNERDYILVSEALMRAIKEYDEILPTIHKEYLLEEWLRPCNLLELAGIPAAKALRREIEVSKEQERRKKLQEKYVEKNKTRAISSIGCCRTTESSINTQNATQKNFSILRAKDRRSVTSSIMSKINREYCISTVSYTHLTLPTNREV
eukprot:TRINITY_DN11083_c0_g1_i1.p1 TRINITY_DN11083_c0_g1~~TRINITY_DN11083_c0_g1_i1.p1  ORF type:complete len:528 (+),score=114.57 TRINITY_DN11083_c0_g1_i1:662-2245(+)